MAAMESENSYKYQDRRAIRLDAQRILALRDKLKEAADLSVNIKHELAGSAMKEELGNDIKRLDQLLNSDYFTRHTRNISFTDRIRDAMLKDPFLAVAVIGSLIAGAYFLYFYIIKPKIYPDFGSFGLLSTSAYAQNKEPPTSQLFLDKGIIALVMLIIFQITAFFVIGLSRNSEARKVSGDFLKVSLGVWVGAAGKSLG